jgi:F0F1-type ATP synthase assembly protein I
MLALSEVSGTRIDGVPEQDKKAAQDSQLTSPGQYLGVGMTLALSTLGFLLLGSFLDGKLGTKPALTVVGAFVGAAAGFYYMYHNLVIVPRQQKSEREERNRRGEV